MQQINCSFQTGNPYSHVHRKQPEFRKQDDKYNLYYKVIEICHSFWFPWSCMYVYILIVHLLIA